MTYSVFLTDRFRRDLDEFLAYANDYHEDWMREQLQRLRRVIDVKIAGSPHTSAAFFVTGSPYRAYLFTVGRRTSFWVVYAVDEAASQINLLRFWNASRDTKSFRV
jgi:uncharacterized membrane protein